MENYLKKQDLTDFVLSQDENEILNVPNIFGIQGSLVSSPLRLNSYQLDFP